MLVGRWMRLSWCAAVLVLSIMGGCWLFTNSGKSVAHLADGRQVVLKRLTYGMSHRYMSGNPLAKTLAYLGVTNWAARLGARTFRDPFPTPVDPPPKADFLMAWIELQGADIPANSPKPAGLTVLDKNGHESNRSVFS